MQPLEAVRQVSHVDDELKGYLLISYLAIAVSKSAFDKGLE